jgi:hypothetical protein
MKETIILMLQQLHGQLKFMHWQTFGDAKHRTYGALYDSLGENIDEFVESMMGKYGRPSFPEKFNLEFTNLEQLDEEQFINSISEYLISLSDELDPRVDSDLLNIRDEMLGHVNQSKYLLTLKY